MEKNKKAKLDPKKICEMLPKGIIEVSVVKNTRTLDMWFNLSEIKREDAEKAAKKVGKELGLVLKDSFDTDGNLAVRLDDPSFNKDMRAAAREMLKAAKAFYLKYDSAFMYDDDTCKLVSEVTKLVSRG